MFGLPMVIPTTKDVEIDEVLMAEVKELVGQNNGLRIKANFVIIYVNRGTLQKLFKPLEFEGFKILDYFNYFAGQECINEY